MKHDHSTLATPPFQPTPPIKPLGVRVRRSNSILPETGTDQSTSTHDSFHSRCLSTLVDHTVSPGKGCLAEFGLISACLTNELLEFGQDSADEAGFDMSEREAEVS